MLKFMLPFLFVFLFVCSSARGKDAETVYDIRGFGAAGDGETLDTEAIQKTIDACSEAGGGRVLIPNGTFLSGTIFLKDDVTLYLSPGAVLKGSPRFEDYQKARSLVTARNVKNVGIEGHGTIDGNGGHENFQSEDKYSGLKGRPHLARFEDCVHVHLRDFNALDSVAWTLSFFRCDRVSVDGVYVRSKVNANNDGIDIVDCHDTKISNCVVDCADDGIVMKSHGERMVRRLTITNCIVRSECNAIKFGTETIGGFEDVTVSNCVITDTRLSGIALEIVDGGRMDRITIDNVTMNRVNGSILIKLGLRKGENPVLRNVSISNVIADGLGAYEQKPDDHFDDVKDSRTGVCIMGRPDFPLENIILRNMTLRFAGNCEREDAKVDDFTDHRPKGYPEYTNFQITPAYGINCRHVKGLRLESITLATDKEDARAAIHLQDVQTVHLSDPRLEASDAAPAFVRVKDSGDVFVTGCKPHRSTIPFISFEGTVRDVSITGNDFSKLDKAFLCEENVSAKEIRSRSNVEPAAP